MSRRTTIVVADDQPIIAEALASSLSRWFNVVGFVTELHELAAELDFRRPDVLLLDLMFRKTSSLDMVAELATRFPSTAIIILTAHTEQPFADAALRAGALGYVIKQATPAELRVAIEEVRAGRIHVTPRMQEAGARSPDAVARNGIVLTDRQRSVLILLRRGHTYAEIAAKLGITTKTVEYHVDTVGRRIGMSGRAQITRWADRFLNEDGTTRGEGP